MDNWKLEKSTTPVMYIINFCFIFILRVPYLPDDLKPKSSSHEDDPFADESNMSWDEDEIFDDNADPLAGLYPNFLCPIFNDLQTVCLEDSILELFAKNGKIKEADLMSLSNKEIIDIINTKNIRYYFFISFEITYLNC